jgi:hypothetical protein
MKLTEKMSYLQGLMDGLDLDTTTKEGKILVQISAVMHDMVSYIEDMQGQIDELSELCDILDEDLGSLEEDVYDLDSCDCEDDDEYDEEFDDDELYEIQCPTCGDSIYLDDGMLEEGSMECPNCGENLEFDFDPDEIDSLECECEEDSE